MRASDLKPVTLEGMNAYTDGYTGASMVSGPALLERLNDLLLILQEQERQIDALRMPGLLKRAHELTEGA